LVLAATAVAPLALAGCGSDKATLATFAGHWQGHGRGVIIAKDGRASESIYTGCCHLAIAVQFQLSRPRGTPGVITETLTGTPYCGKRAKAWNTKDWLTAGCGV
jgi:hypothetical protein